MDLRDSVAQRAMEAGGRLKVKSALNPILWLCAIVTIPGLSFMSFSDKEISLLFQVLFALPVIAAIVGFMFLLFYDRDKLQSEDYQIRKRTLELVQEKGDDFPQIERTLGVITNPAYRSIEHEAQEEKE
ncbi:TPA: hypothetical protein ACGVBV_004365 [Vibrio vulnificus]